MLKNKLAFAAGSAVTVAISSSCLAFADGPPPGSFSSTYKEPGSSAPPAGSFSSTYSGSAPATGGFSSTYQGPDVSNPSSPTSGSSSTYQAPAAGSSAATGSTPQTSDQTGENGQQPARRSGFGRKLRSFFGSAAGALMQEPNQNPGYGTTSPYTLAPPIYSTPEQGTAGGVSTAPAPAPAPSGPYSIAAAQSFSGKQDWNGMANYGYSWLAADKNSGDAWYCYGEGVFHLQRYNDAITSFQNATRLSPRQPLFWNGLCASYSGVGNIAAASKALADGEAQSGAGQPAIYWYIFGNAAKDLNELDHAIRDYQTAVQLNPGFGEAWTNMGVANELKGDRTLALQDYEKGASLGNNLGAENATRMRTSAVAQTPGQARANGGLMGWQQTSNYQVSQWYHNLHPSVINAFNSQKAPFAQHM